MTREPSSRFFVVTGGPGSGKTTLIDALAAVGPARTLEAGRAIIQDQVAIGGRALPWSDRQLYVELMLSWEMRSYRLAVEHNAPVIFDRGMPDIVGYLHVAGLPVPPHVDRAARTLRYNRRVFIAPPWREIFNPDAERKQTFAEAERTYRAMVDVYTEYDYELIALPLASVSERVGFVAAKIATAST